MAIRRLTICLPEPLLDTLFAEGSRTFESPGQVAARVLREALPGYIESRLRRDLVPVVRARVLNAEIVSDFPPNAATPPALTDGVTPNPMVPQPQATHTLTAGDLDDEDIRGGSID
jgi:hypothetical protein